MDMHIIVIQMTQKITTYMVLLFCQIFKGSLLSLCFLLNNLFVISKIKKIIFIFDAIPVFHWKLLLYL